MQEEFAQFRRELDKEGQEVANHFNAMFKIIAKQRSQGPAVQPS